MANEFRKKNQEKKTIHNSPEKYLEEPLTKKVKICTIKILRD